MTKIPQFDKALDEILKDLKPHDRICKQCGQTFHIFQEDIDFYEMLRVPPPTLCPLCRKKRRFGHLMRVPKFFKKRCSAPDHEEEVVTVYPPASPHKIYDFSYWYSDNWEAAEFGRDYDFSKSFFTQFKDLFFEIPHIPLERDPRGVNTEYTVGGSKSKNNYYCGMGYETENSVYSLDVRHCREVIDCSIMSNSEICFGSVGSYNCSRCLFVVDCGECMDSAFLYECKNCAHCFLCSNLRNRSYVFNNEQLTKEEYNDRIKSINLGNRDILNHHLEQFYGNVVRRALHRALRNVHTTNSIGDDLIECKGCYYVFRAAKAENVRYADNLEGAHDNIDVANVIGEQIYECVVSVGAATNLFSMFIRQSSFMEYCSECRNCNYCFGCAGLKDKKFHIFNKSYSETDYWSFVDRIKTQMLVQGEYGEFFPLKLGLISYQSSTGQLYFSLNEKEAAVMTIPWYSEPESNIPTNMPLLKAPDEVPSDIREVSDDILGKAIICEASGKPFRLVRQELDFYRKMNLPLPTKHPWQRLLERTKLEHSLLLHPFKCPKCGEQTHTVYSPEQQKELKIYCEACYLKEVV